MLGSLHTLKQDGVLYDVADQHEDLKWYVPFYYFRAIVSCTQNFNCIINILRSLTTLLNAFRTGDVTLHQHQTDYAEKNEFLKDLEKLDVSHL